MKKRLILGMTGASGIPITIEFLKQMKSYQDSVEIHLIYSKSAILTLEQETNLSLDQLKSLTDIVYDNENISLEPASGSAKFDAMVIVPCSMKTVAGIASGYSESLLLRAADVTLKERRKLILVPRECPFSTIHLRNMYELSQMGVVMIPPVLSYYNHPESVEDCTKHIVGKIMDQLSFEMKDYSRWKGMHIS